MRRILAVVFLLSFSLLAPARTPARDPRIDAATADAMESLRAEVLAAHVTPNLTVKDLLDRAGGTDELDKALDGAEQMGGPRWLGEQTAQIRLSIDGSRISRAIQAAVSAHPERSPIPPDVLRQQLASWSDRTFWATGTSTGSAALERLRPPASNPLWRAVSDADRRRALLAARDNAIQRVLDSLSAVTLEKGESLGQALADPTVGEPVRNWLASRPLKTIEFGDDLVVRLTLAVPPEQLWQTLKTAGTGHQGFPENSADWQSLRERVMNRVVPATGVGLVGPAAQTRPIGIMLPAQPPDWAVRQIEAEGTAASVGSKLHTARAAEAVAMDKLRQQIDALPLTKDLTIGAASHHDPNVEQAIARALRHAHPYQVDYRAKGTVTVHVALNLSKLWSEMNNP